VRVSVPIGGRSRTCRSAAHTRTRIAPVPSSIANEKLDDVAAAAAAVLLPPLALLLPLLIPLDLLIEALALLLLLLLLVAPLPVVMSMPDVCLSASSC
jgi:hypothetical protein